jgi:hypothetical protein
MHPRRKVNCEVDMSVPEWERTHTKSENVTSIPSRVWTTPNGPSSVAIIEHGGGLPMVP